MPVGMPKYQPELLERHQRGHSEPLKCADVDRLNENPVDLRNPSVTCIILGIDSAVS